MCYDGEAFGLTPFMLRSFDLSVDYRVISGVEYVLSMSPGVKSDISVSSRMVCGLKIIIYSMRLQV